METTIEPLSAFAYFQKQKQLENNKKLKRKHNGFNGNVSTKKVKQEQIKVEKNSSAQVLKNNKAKTQAPRVLVNANKKKIKLVNGSQKKLQTNGQPKSKSQIKTEKTKTLNGTDGKKRKTNEVTPSLNNISPLSDDDSFNQSAPEPEGDVDEIPQLVEIPTKTELKKKTKPKKQTDANILKSPTKKLKSKVPKIIYSTTPSAIPPAEDDTASMNGSQLFKWLINPVSPGDFFKKYWEHDCLLIERNSPTYYKHIFSSQALDKILRDHTLFFTRNIDVVSYENGIKQTFNQEGRATPAILWDYYANGCSIRLLNPQTYHKQVHLLLATLQEYFGTMVGANTYLTPPGSQGFAPHYDDIEAFIVQLEGRKHWKLYKPKGADVLARDSSPNFKPEDLGEPFMEVTLNAGDLLYFPRGTIHEGHTDEEQHSLHITLSVYQHTAYVDLLEHILPAALKKAAQSDVEFRKGLPLQYLQHVGHINKERKSIVKNQIINKVKDLMKTLIDYVEIDEAADELGRKFMHDCMPPILMQSEVARMSKGDGDFMRNGQVFNRVEIGLDTKVRLLRYHCLRLVPNESTANIYYCTDNAKVYHGEEEQWLEIEKSLIPVIKTLQTSYPNYVEVEALPGTDVAGRLQLISDLWEKGLLVTEDYLPIVDDTQDD